MLMERHSFLRRLFAVTSWVLAPVDPVHAFSASPAPKATIADVASVGSEEKGPVLTALEELKGSTQSNVAYQEFLLPIDQFGVKVPVSCWFSEENQSTPTSTSSSTTTKKSNPPLYYKYRISVRKIGQMLAGWEFIPGFYAREFNLSPSQVDRVLAAVGTDQPRLPKSGPVILLAHGFLGSRFDLSHLAEELAAEGFTCFSVEYPESLAATYDRMDGLDRAVINDKLLQYLEDDLKIKPTKYGIVGHSLGCKTVVTTGTEDWARVLIAGGPRLPDGSAIPGNALFVSSMNDGAMSPGRFGGSQGYPRDIVLLTEGEEGSFERLPSRAAILYDRPDAPNHISFLAESVNDAMIEFLSALLPVARAFEIPLLDFDRYQISRDSRQTAEIVHPLIVRYLKQEMMEKIDYS